jgi:CRP/FNR family transcriptional regulator, cyclic AMP receptor protein
MLLEACGPGGQVTVNDLRKRVLRAHLLFAALSETELNALAAVMVTVTAEPGETLIAEGDRPEHAVVVTHGTALVFVAGQAARTVCVDVIGAGALVGELGLIDGFPRAATVRALARCEFQSIPARAFRATYSSNAALSAHVGRYVASTYRRSTSQLTRLLSMDVRHRLVWWLIRLSEDLHGTRDRLVPSHSQGHHLLAEIVGCARETVTRELTLLKRAGHLEEATNGLCLKPTIRQLLPWTTGGLAETRCDLRHRRISLQELG